MTAAGPRILAIETSSRHGSVAVAAGPSLLAAEEFASDLRHAVELLPAIDRLCRRAGWKPDGVEQVFVSIGPGSFTGLRVAVTVARHLALACGAKIVGVPSLGVTADNARTISRPPPHVAVVLDAKRGQVYAGLFVLGADAYVAVGDAVVIEPAAWLAGLPRPLAVMGEGIGYHRVAIDAAGVDVLPDVVSWPKAEAVHRLGWRLAERGAFTEPGELTPHYLRRPEAEELWEKRAAASSQGMETH